MRFFNMTINIYVSSYDRYDTVPIVVELGRMYLYNKWIDYDLFILSLGDLHNIIGADRSHVEYQVQ